MATIVKRSGLDGSATYQVRVRLHGERPRSRTFKRKTDAKAWAAEVESRLSRGAFVPTGADRRRTLAELIDVYLTEGLPVKLHARSAPKLRVQLAWWREHAGYVTLDKLTPQTIAGFRSELAKRITRHGTPLTGATLNRYLAALSAVCKWAWKEQGLLPANPVLSVTKRPEHPAPGRCLTNDERARLLQACRDDADRNIYCAVMLALATGCRFSNIRWLRWEDVDFTRWTFALATTKNGDPRTVPIVGDAQTVLRAQFDADPTGADWVFKGQRDAVPASLESAWQRVRAAAELPGFRFHDLRHTTGSYLAMSGASLVEVAEALGHKTLVMARRYSHVTAEHTRGVLERGVRLEQ